jgi:hypothetical protein
MGQRVPSLFMKSKVPPIPQGAPCRIYTEGMLYPDGDPRNPPHDWQNIWLLGSLVAAGLAVGIALFCEVIGWL